jgi:competence protein ComGC
MTRLEAVTNTGKQRGVVLVVSLIMLLVLTLIAVSAANIAQTNLKVVQNLESREMALYAAKAALEEAISSNRFTLSPGNIFQTNCSQPNEKCYDINGDGGNDVEVFVEKPACVIVMPIRNAELDVFNSADDAQCFLPPGEFSMCARSVWELRATATDAVTGARVSVRQGVSILTTLNNIASVCPV